MSELETAIRKAVEHAISVVGMDGLRATSMFPSSAKRDGGSAFFEQEWGG